MGCAEMQFSLIVIPVGADYSSVLVRQHAGTRGGCRRAGVGAENAVTLRDLGIFVDQPGEPVSTQDPDILAHSEWTLTPGGRSLAQRPVRAMNVIVLDVLTQDQP